MKTWLGMATVACVSAGALGALGCEGEYRSYELADEGEVQVENTAVDQAAGSLQFGSGATSVDAGQSEKACAGCFIDGVCFTPDARKEGNPCQVCDPARDLRRWSNDDAAVCDDGAFCTVNDVCTAGSCVGIERECDDGVECNGTSTCIEETDSCSPALSQCGDSLCDVGTDTCVSTCDGCIVNGVCIPDGAEALGNACQVCDSDVSATAYTVAVGKNCGSLATACSGQDTCDAQGRCQPNHLPPNSPCGEPAASACDLGDACDGLGNCQQRTAQNGAPCDDGAFCTTGDQCQAGQCIATGQQNCGANRICNEAANQCQCQGCQIGEVCFAAGAADPQNPCQVCNPASNSVGFSANAGAACGSGPADCSEQDTCNSQGQCVPNDRPNGSACSSAVGGSCQNGQCVGCAGCTIGGFCLAAGTIDSANPCQVCDPNRSRAAFSVNVGGPCGAGPTQCSAQDTCSAQGQCSPNNLPNGTPCTSVPRGACQNAVCVSATLPLGATCTQDSECSSERCQTFYRDRDGDGFGADDPVDLLRACSSAATQSVSPVAGYSPLPGDCCDRGGADGVQTRTIFPGQTQFFDTPQNICSNIADRDYNCSGAVEFLFQDATQRGGGGCAFPGCDGETVWDLAQIGGTPPRCGAAAPILLCSGASGACTATPQGFTVNFCR